MEAPWEAVARARAWRASLTRGRRGPSPEASNLERKSEADRQRKAEDDEAYVARRCASPPPDGLPDLLPEEVRAHARRRTASTTMAAMVMIVGLTNTINTNTTRQLWVRILANLPVRSWKSVARVCVALRRIAQDQMVVRTKRSSSSSSSSSACRREKEEDDDEEDEADGLLTHRHTQQDPVVQYKRKREEARLRILASSAVTRHG